MQEEGSVSITGSRMVTDRSVNEPMGCVAVCLPADS